MRGYAWLTNHVAPDQPTYRILLVLSMGGFRVLALAVPDAFDGDGVVFGSAFLLVTLIHSWLFSRSQEVHSFGAMVRLTPLNIVAALLILAAIGRRLNGADVIWFLLLQQHRVGVRVVGVTGM